MTYEFVDLNKAYWEGVISSREYVDMAEWLATAENREDPNEIHLANLRHALEESMLSPAEYVSMADFFYDWLLDRLATPAGATESDDESEETFGGWPAATKVPGASSRKRPAIVSQLDGLQ